MANEETPPETKKKLSTRHQVFVDEYLKCWNATDAYQKAFPKANRNTARNNGARLLADASIQAEIQARLAEIHMGADEALKLLADQARGDVAQLMDVSGMGFNLDMQKAQEAGLTKLIRKVKQKTTTYLAKGESDEDREVTELEIELYSAKDAIDTILKVGGKINDNVTINVTLTDD